MKSSLATKFQKGLSNNAILLWMYDKALKDPIF